jgi:peptide deformylase
MNEEQNPELQRKRSRDEVLDMMIAGMRIVTYPHKGLRNKSEPIGEGEFTDETKMLVESLSTVMLRNGGVALTAPQCLIHLRIVIVNLSGKKEDNVAIINPRIVESSEKTARVNETSLSFPKISVPVRRPVSVKIKAETFEGKTVDLELKGVAARVVQHAMDHLDGKLLIDYASPLKRKLIEKKLSKRRLSNKPISRPKRRRKARNG